MASTTMQMRATKLSSPSVARPSAKFAGSSVASKHSALCGCSSCRNVSAKATISIKVNDTAMVLNNVKEGSNVEVDMTPTAAGAAPAATDGGSSNGGPKFVGDAAHMKKRTLAVQKHMPGSIAADDYLSRCEILLCAHGFRGDNTIGVSNLCRDESTGILKSKIEAIFGANFNINGLGAVLTCGATGMGAGLSHAPIDPSSSRERYVFFSYPHIAIDDEGNLGKIHRPGRAGESAACGALLTALSLFQGDGLDAHVKDPGVHDIDEPEFSILKQRVARRIVSEGLNVDKLDIAALTKVAERRITYDLEQLIEMAVDTSKADYAVCTGVQIHSWPDPATGAPAIEFVMPTKTYVVIDGKRTDIRLDAVPALSPRQLSLLSTGALKEVHPEDQLMNAYLQGSTVVELEQPDPAGNPGLAGVKSAKQSLLFKNTSDEAEQEGHVKPKWADVYCC